MRIVLVTSGLLYGGAETQIIAMSRELASRGHAVAIYTTTNLTPRRDELDGSGVELIVDQKKAALDPFLIYRLRRFVQRFQADVVHGFLFDGKQPATHIRVISGFAFAFSGGASTQIDAALTITMRQIQKTSLCFVAPAIWPVFSGDRSIRSVGGAEVQQSMLARALAASGYPVSIVTFDYGQPNGVEIDGVKVYKACGLNEGLPVVRFVYPRLTSLWQAMKQAKAQVYYQRACGMLTGVVAHYCRVHGAKMLYAAASDADFEPDLPLIRYGRDRALYRYGLRHSHAVIAQNADQMAACKQAFGHEARLIKSCYLAPANAGSNPSGPILWVSTIRRLKQPEAFLELARMLPQYRFKMVGGPGAKLEERNLFESLKEKSSGMRNLEIAGFVPYAEIDAHFNQASLFVNTSEFEGFPNTFLQAWSRGIPTVSFLKGKTTNTGHGPDWSVENLQEMASAIRQLMDSPDLLQRQGEICRLHYLDNHSQDAVVDQYRELISIVAQSEIRRNAA